MDIHHGAAPRPFAPLPAGILASLRRGIAATPTDTDAAERFNALPDSAALE
jgi:hypothetical protein